jgi:hypothetical protein
VHNMFVEDLKIWTAGDYIFNMFDNCKDSHFFMAAGSSIFFRSLFSYSSRI